MADPELENPHGPKTKDELRVLLTKLIEEHGIHGTLMEKCSPEESNCDALDPGLAHLWRAYVDALHDIETHLEDEYSEPS